MPRRRVLADTAPAARAALVRNTRARKRLTDALPQLIRQAHDAGWTWEQIGELTGYSGGGAWNISRTEK